MAELKTQRTGASVAAFLQGIPDEQKRRDSLAIVELMQQVTGSEPQMWGSSIIGFGDYHYKYASGREGDWFLVGLSPRKQNLTLYIAGGLEQHSKLLNTLGKHKTGKGCLYISKLQDIDLAVLRTLIEQSVEQIRNSKA